MIPPLQFPGWQWMALALSTPVVWWCGWTFHQGASAALRHRSASMDTLISLGSGVSWAWSVVAVLFLGAGEIGMTMHMSLLPSDSMGAEIYFEVAAGIVTLVLLGRFLEARARRSAGKPAGNTAVASAPRQAPRVAAPAQAGQPIATARPATGFPRPSELFDNWAGVGLLIALGVIAVLLLRKRN